MTLRLQGAMGTRETRTQGALVAALRARPRTPCRAGQCVLVAKASILNSLPGAATTGSAQSRVRSPGAAVGCDALPAFRIVPPARPGCRGRGERTDDPADDHGRRDRRPVSERRECDRPERARGLGDHRVHRQDCWRGAVHPPRDGEASCASGWRRRLRHSNRGMPPRCRSARLRAPSPRRSRPARAGAPPPTEQPRLGCRPERPPQRRPQRRATPASSPGP